jgi:hypothetical protein
MASNVATLILLSLSLASSLVARFAAETRRHVSFLHLRSRLPRFLCHLCFAAAAPLLPKCICTLCHISILKTNSSFYYVLLSHVAVGLALSHSSPCRFIYIDLSRHKLTIQHVVLQTAFANSCSPGQCSQRESCCQLEAVEQSITTAFQCC